MTVSGAVLDSGHAARRAINERLLASVDPQGGRIVQTRFVIDAFRWAVYVDAPRPVEGDHTVSLYAEIEPTPS